MKNNNIEFGSRWRQKLMPTSVSRGKSNAFIIARDKKRGGKGKTDPSKTFRESIKVDQGWSKDSEEIIKDGWTKSKNKGKFNALGIKRGAKRQNLLRPANTRGQGNRLVRSNVKNISKRVADVINKTTEGMVGPFQSKVPKKGLSEKTKAAVERIELKQANKKIDKTVDDFNKAVQAPNNVVDSPKSSTSEVIKPKNLLKRSGSRKGLLVGAGIAAGTVTLGGLGYGVYRKMRSDKGKKRGKYKNF